jgi:hypothetical protein
MTGRPKSGVKLPKGIYNRPFTLFEASMATVLPFTFAVSLSG